MIWKLFALFTFSALAYATPPRASTLMIGDSLTVGNFGEKFAADILASRPDASFYQVAAWGSAPKDWTTGAPVFQTIGTAHRARGQSQVNDPTKAPFLTQLYRQWFGQPTYSTPKLSALVAEKKATHLIVALGTNQLSALQRNPADPDVPGSILKLITEARSLGITHLDWIGPPVLQRFSSATIESFYQVLENTLRNSDHHNFVTIWDSRRWIDAYPADFSFKDDGIHFFHSAGLRATSAWAKSAANAISNTAELSGEIEGLHYSAYGNPARPVLIFIHGGPGYDSQDFELTTARPLAARGYYVVTYDQRGQGRSAPAKDPTDYGYAKYAADLELLISKLNLSQPTLIGHSHGGPIALQFDAHYPNVAKKIVLVSAPIDFWQTMESIRDNCLNSDFGPRLQADLAQSFLDMADHAAKKVILGVSAAFSLGEKCGLYAVKNPSPKSQTLRAKLQTQYRKVRDENRYYPMPHFVLNENFFRRDHSPQVRAHAEHIFGIYGLEDGLFTGKVLDQISERLKANPHPHRMQTIAGASHSLYIDQQALFFKAIDRIMKAD